jgi:hypothetical protein
MKCLFLLNLILFINTQTDINIKKNDLKCTNDRECGKGKCESGVCKCENGYTTFPEDSRDVCNYEQYTQKKAFLFELFFGFGAGNFYAGRTTHGALKLVSFIFGIYIICLFPISAKFISQKLNSECVVIFISCFYYICSLGLAFWFIYDLVQFGMNSYLDGNGVGLHPW